jgi:phosphoribosyl 1,2-cyclic phosphodiesterase
MIRHQVYRPQRSGDPRVPGAVGGRKAAEPVLSVRSLGSGSSGNALLVEDGGSAVLVDCGLQPRLLTSALRRAGRALADLDAVLLTHEHSDHARALPLVLRAAVPVVATGGTAAAAGLSPRAHLAARDDTPFQVGSLRVTPHLVSHDAAEPCAYRIEGSSGCLFVATDLGRANDAWRDLLAWCDLIVLEANHDLLMLQSGPYPARLKRRVLSATGHLSNADCGRFLAAALAAAAARPSRPNPTIWLAHLSQTNNRPVLAEETVRRALSERGLHPPIVPLPRHGGDTVWRLGVEPSPVPRQLSIFSD